MENKSYLDNVIKCWGVKSAEDLYHYHDNDWGLPVSDDFRLFEKMTLESFQSGLSWRTILNKRDNFRQAFFQFDFNRVAGLVESDVEELLTNAGIIRHRGKIEAAINNAKCAQSIGKEFGSFAAYIWTWEPANVADDNEARPSATDESKKLSADLKRRGWKFFGPTTAYAFMQTAGLVNDHRKECGCYTKVEQARKAFARPTPIR
ncbi:DNA-3-methyladenine glycosylase I [Vibrio profundum]|uniref:DNA-3-methyladenine glycosylase I n=1 Tax=Vibrio profundum TaxID=2910247 RepID=UPI003D12B910